MTDSLLAKTPSIEELLAQSRRVPTAGAVTKIMCCCGHDDCLYLTKNNAALDDLEKDVHTAAQLGQALLIRHEQHMADAERQRAAMTAKIEQLEADNLALEAANAASAEENKSLMRQLDDLNDTYSASEVRVKALEGSLLATQQEMRRLESLASRAHDLEEQLAALEEEHAALQKTVALTAEEERSAVQRWRQAERGLIELQEQLERIEREAREERERHVEVIGRMERQRTVEKELDNAAGRLKGAAAVNAMGAGKPGNTVVTHFVKDILQDNANLQLGILELREMLEHSNSEVQALREQLLLHSPSRESRASTLRAELAPQDPQVISQELHIHHHYHTPNTPEPKRPKKKRTSINPGLFTPPAVASHRSSTPQSIQAAILGQTSSTVPMDHRWSVQSSVMSDMASSVPSSPQSAFRNSAVFDRSFDYDSIPTSPVSSTGPLSPTVKHAHRDSDLSMRGFFAPLYPNTIQEEDEVEDARIKDVSDPDAAHEADTEQSMPSLDSDVSTEDDFSYRSRLRRTTSHESILSVSGIDIHTLRSRPSQLALSSGIINPRTRLGAGSTTSVLSTENVLGSSPAAKPTFARRVDSSSYLRSTFAAHAQPSPQSFTGKVGGWVWSRWGSTPSPADDASASTASTESTPTVKRAVSSPLMQRTPGINQNGPIPGLMKPRPAPSQVVVGHIDQASLQEVLQE